MSKDEPTVAARRGKPPTGKAKPATPTPSQIGEGETVDAGPGTTPGGRLPSADHLPQGERVGRYEIRGVVGEGGMGVVYTAHDPELDRTIAIKLVRYGGAGSADTDGRARMLREAQALALLSHPSVVGIFDVGRHDDGLFLAMEYADGPTLKEWLAERGRTWREVVALFTAVGRGLAAAHDKGLVHRDVKPENIFLWRDGRVGIGDFGLARADADAASDRGPVVDVEQSNPVYISLTRTGAVLGTPPYMAPEQHRGQPADARSDQFSFCVALWEALYGDRPFRGADLAGVRAAILDGALPEPPASAGVPRRIARVLARGLSVAPADRYPSMQALLDDLAPPARGRGRALIAAFAGVAVAGVGLGIALSGGGPRDVCAASDRRLAGVWDGGAREQTRAAFAATELPFAAPAFERVASGLDDYARRFTAAHRDACEATRVRGDYGDDVLELRMACLDRGVAELSALSALLRAADADVVRGAVDAVHALPPPEACADVAALRERGGLPASEAARARIADADRRLGEARARFHASDLDGALAIVEPLVADTDALGHRPLEAEIRQLAGMIYRTNGRLDDADAALRDAVFRAEAGRADAVAAEAWIDLVLVSRDRDAWDEAAERQQRAIAAVERLGNPPALTADLYGAIGAVEIQRGRWAEAEVAYERALEAAPDDEPGLRATAAAGLGTVHWRRNELDPAIDRFREALELRERAFGPRHPVVAESLVLLCIVYEARGAFDQALELHERALAIYEGAYGPDHIRVADALSAVGGVLHSLGRHDEALAVNQRALAIRAATLGEEHTDLAQNHVNIGIALKNLGRYDEAVAAYERALASYERAYGPDDFRVAITEINLGEVLRVRGDPAGALPHYERALAILEAALGADHAVLAHPLTGIGESRLALGDPRAALPPLRRAHALRSADQGNPVDLAQTELALAQALWATARTPGDRRRAVELATRAEAAYRAVGEGRATEADAAAAWLAGKR